MIESIEELKGYFQDEMQSRIKTFYVGEVAVVPKHKCAALMVYPISSSVIARSTASDDEQNVVGVKIVDILPNYIEVDGDKETIQATQWLTKAMQERNSDNQYKEDTVMGVLRKTANVRGNNYIFNDVSEISYNIIQQGEWFYISATMTVQLNNILPRP